MNTVVLLLSKQALPNLSFVKLLKAQNSPIQRYILIGSDFTEKNKFHLHLIEALGLKEGEYELWKIDAESYVQAKKDLAQQLAQAQHQAAQKFWLHLTGGTKMMAMAAQDSFKKHSKTTKSVQLGSYYMPFGGKVLHKIYPQAKSKKISLHYTLEEYFTSYGFDIQAEQAVCKADEMEAYWTLLKENNFDLKSAALNKYRLHKKENATLWEELIYHKVKTSLNLADDQIAISLKISSKYRNLKHLKDSTNDNELDVVFVLKDKLYIIECKSSKSTANRTIKKTAQEAIYKLTAIKDGLGLHATGVVAILAGDKLDGASLERIELQGKAMNNKFVEAQDLVSSTIKDCLEIK
ncbi:Card1-like endonuclease domain-containing protein [Saprospira grandis]|uniref:DUF1887 family protein n=1 Tax=Saprospira grandis (strain Lewin) TaxID=984262 RepID=H6L2K9_SAPGL|nr:DUF1887 family CARF protein [Saprospira grandis]AFC23667.1 hypothetical protein SGRA_0931 [Saprospira grandis str. Lewin]